MGHIVSADSLKNPPENRQPARLIHAQDNVAVATQAIAASEELSIGSNHIRSLEAIEKGHKIAVCDIAQGTPVKKYGADIGVANRPIKAGQHVHVHNVQSALSGTIDYATIVPEGSAAASPSKADKRHFMGYLRDDGRAGTRNEIWLISSVGCSAMAAQHAAFKANLNRAENIDYVLAVTHQFGCSQMGDDMVATQTLLAALADNPNAAGVVFVGLGCETNQIDALLAAAPWLATKPIRQVITQDVADEQQAILAAIDDISAALSAVKRTKIGLEKLVVGLKCGGSDGFSGITANPLLGRFSDYLTAQGGGVILTEIPEIFGAETSLMKRAISQHVSSQISDLTNRFKDYFIRHNQPVYENPSPGNKQGGITTLEEKSWGAVQKAGQAPVHGVLLYGERAKAKGVTLLESPGNDAISTTAMAAAGATLILFTTGRGTPLGCPVPTLKIASHTELAQRKPKWIDFDAGVCLSQESYGDADAAFLDLICNIASGQQTLNERSDERAIAIWKTGVTL